MTPYFLQEHHQTKGLKQAGGVVCLEEEEYSPCSCQHPFCDQGEHSEKTAGEEGENADVLVLGIHALELGRSPKEFSKYRSMALTLEEIAHKTQE